MLFSNRLSISSSCTRVRFGTVIQFSNTKRDLKIVIPLDFTASFYITLIDIPFQDTVLETVSINEISSSVENLTHSANTTIV